jgi:hypothetical protein
VNPSRRLAVGGALVALTAWAGAVALMAGAVSLGFDLNRRLPWHSPVLGGVALMIVVAVPMSVLAVLAWRNDRRTRIVGVVSGVLLVGWILVEYAFLRELSFFHPLYVAVGLAVLVSSLRR